MDSLGRDMASLWDEHGSRGAVADVLFDCCILLNAVHRATGVYVVMTFFKDCSFLFQRDLIRR